MKIEHVVANYVAKQEHTPEETKELSKALFQAVKTMHINAREFQDFLEQLLEASNGSQR